MEGWILEVLYCDPKFRRAFLGFLFTEGRGLRLCWEKSNSTGPRGIKRLYIFLCPKVLNIFFIGIYVVRGVEPLILSELSSGMAQRPTQHKIAVASNLARFDLDL